MPLTKSGQRRLAKAQRLTSLSNDLTTRTHFNTEECKALLSVHEKMSANGKIDRLKFREFLHCCFDITDDVMLDLTFRGFDRNADGVVDEFEFVYGLSAMLRGDLNELTEFCYFVYDMNGDRSLAREELYHCLKGCIYPGYGIEPDEIEDAERDIVEIVMRKLDTNRDGQITSDDFANATHKDPLLVQSVGACLPTPKAMATFLSTICEQYRAYAPSYAYEDQDHPKHKSKLNVAMDPIDKYLLRKVPQ